MLRATNAPLPFYGILPQLFIQLRSISHRGGIATMLQIKCIIFSFPIRTLWIDPLYYCILPLFFLYIHTTRHLLIDALYRHRPDRPWGAGGGSEDPGSVQGIQKQEQPEPTLSLPRLHPCQRKTALPWNYFGQSSQQSPNNPKKNPQIVPLCRWLYCGLFYITLACSFKYILPLFDHLTLKGSCCSQQH